MSSERVRVSEGEIVAKKHDVLNTIECKIDDENRFDCKTFALGGLSLDFRNVYSLDGDIGVVSGGDSKIWLKPRPVGSSCALFIYERKEGETPLGKEIKVVCGIKGQQMLEAYSLWDKRGIPVRPGTLWFWESLTVEEMANHLEAKEKEEN